MASSKEKGSVPAQASLKTSATAAGDGTEQAYPIKITFSDGRVHNGTPAMYTAVEDDDESVEKWKFKLGAMLANELLPADDKRLCYLESLPDRYKLNRATGKKDKKRTDLYLLGHPAGASKSFRSPAEFFPHLLYLIGGTRDIKQCSCRHCKEQSAKKQLLKDKKKTSTPVTREPIQGAQTLVQPASAYQPQFPQVSQSQVQAQTQAYAQAQATQAPPSGYNTQYTSTTSQAQTPMLQGQSQPEEEHIDLHDLIATHREGDGVWFQQNSAWRLGTVLKRMSNQSSDGYLIAPLSYPLHPLTNLVKTEQEMRPFLAFSVPGLFDKLRAIEASGQAIKDINWAELEFQLWNNASPKKEALSLEASKLAAIVVDHSYSLFNPRATYPGGSDGGGGGGGAIESYGGMFFGAEKIYVNEAVRLRYHDQDPRWNKSLPIVLVISEILFQPPEERKGLFFRGDVWRLEETAITSSPAPPLPAEPSTTITTTTTSSPSSSVASSDASLPSAMLREKQFRNKVLAPKGRQADWVCVRRSFEVDTNDSSKDPAKQSSASAVRGRFYETEKIACTLNAAEFDKMRREGRVLDVQAFLNNRADSNGRGRGRRRSRAETLEGAVSVPTEGLVFKGIKEG